MLSSFLKLHVELATQQCESLAPAVLERPSVAGLERLPYHERDDVWGGSHTEVEFYCSDVTNGVGFPLMLAVLDCSPSILQ